MDIEQLKKLLEIAAGLAGVAGEVGVPFAGFGAVLLTEIDALIGQIADSTGLTREEIAAQTRIEGAKDLIEELKDREVGV